MKIKTSLPLSILSTLIMVSAVFFGQPSLAKSSAAQIKKTTSYPVALREAHRLSRQGKDVLALKKLSDVGLQKSTHRDLVNLTRGRVSFNLKQYDKSLQFYKMIPRTSEHWLTSVEERAWVLVHLGKKNEAVADSLTLMSPLFADVVSPEAYYLSAYVAHQICDFDRVFNIIQSFKKNGRGTLVELEKQNKIKPSKLKNLRIHHFADVIRQLNLIEADAIQRIYLDQSLAGKRTKAAGIDREDKYALHFPYDEDDVWIDEVDQLKVSAENCPIPFQQVVAR